MISNPEALQKTKKYETCHLENLPLDLEEPLISVSNGTIRACGKNDQEQKCFRLDNKNWISFNQMDAMRSEAAGITFGNGSWWITGGKTTNGTAHSTSEIIHPGHPGLPLFFS